MISLILDFSDKKGRPFVNKKKKKISLIIYVKAINKVATKH